MGVRRGWVVVLVACAAASVAAAIPRAEDPRAASAEGDPGIEASVWHPLRSGCYREVLGQSSVDWSRATSAHEGATSTSSLRFWSYRELGAEVLVIDSGGSPRLSADGSPFVVVASGALDRTCVERMSFEACPEAVELRRSLLEQRIRIGDAVTDDGGMTLLLGSGGYGVEVMDWFAKRNRWYFGELHPDFPVMRERFGAVDRCFAKVREAERRWAADPKAAPPTL
jgi:hypothetical protein